VPFRGQARIYKTPEQKREYNREKSKRYYNSFKEKYGVNLINERRHRRKTLVVGLLGNKCQICGYDRCVKNLNFHHVFPKKFRMDGRGFQLSYEKCMNELAKCILVCPTCHGEAHFGLVSQHEIKKANNLTAEKIKSVKKEDWKRNVLNQREDT
jgi:hypothetical protein